MKKTSSSKRKPFSKFLKRKPTENSTATSSATVGTRKVFPKNFFSTHIAVNDND